jgi:hypothetical protein
MGFFTALLRLTCFVAFFGSSGVTALLAQARPDLEQMVKMVVANERSAAQNKPPFLYTSVERSDRTGGHVWTERVVEIPQGKLRYLLAEDGHPLSAGRQDQEISRLKMIAADPSDFIHREQSRKDDEERAERMLDLLPTAFLFDSPGNEGSYLRINFRPNPAYEPQTYEQRVLHSMSGFILIDSKTLRLRHLEGHLGSDVSFAYGLLATIRGGGEFSTTRDRIAPNMWKATLIDVHIDGRAILFKTISLHQHSEHEDFHPVPENLSIPEAIQLLEK